MGEKMRKKIDNRPKLTSNTAADSWPSGPSPPPWIDLPTDVTANILLRLGPIEILETAQFVCCTWWRVCKEDPSMWRVIDMKNSGGGEGDHDKYKYYKYLRLMCRSAVDRSQGELIDINIEYFCDDAIMRYIADRSPRLKRLRIACSPFLWELARAVKKWPELEELHLFYTRYFYARVIESIGISCPMLKSFTFNRRCYREPILEINDSCAVVIAKTMPNLRQLRLFGNKLTNQGLQDILDGCPHLELLDLRQCLRVDLQGGLDKRCSERIKDFRGPSDSTADYEWDDEVYEDEDVSDCDDVDFDSDDFDFDG